MPHQFFDCRAVSFAEAIGTGRLAAHIRGAVRDEYTRQGPRAGAGVIHLVDEVEALRAALAAINRDQSARRGKPGRRPKGAIGLLFTGPPRWDGANGKPLSPAQQRAWMHGCVNFVRGRLPPGCVIALAVAHLDESALHLHMVIVPFCEETGLIDWRTCQSRMAGKTPRPPVITRGMTAEQRKAAKRAEYEAASIEMEQLQDAFWCEVSSVFGIGRGIPKRKRKAQALDRIKAAELDAASAEAGVARARKAREVVIADARRALRGAEEAADRALARHDREVEAMAAVREERERVEGQLGEVREAVERAKAAGREVVADARRDLVEVEDEVRRQADLAAASRAESARLDEAVAAAREVPFVQLAVRVREAERDIEILADALARERRETARLRAAIGRVVARTRRRTWALARRLVSQGFASYRSEDYRPGQGHDQFFDYAARAARLSRNVARRRRREGPQRYEVPGLEGLGTGPAPPAPVAVEPGPVPPAPAPAPVEVDAAELFPAHLPGVGTAPARRRGSRDRDVGPGV